MRGSRPRLHSTRLHRNVFQRVLALCDLPAEPVLSECSLRSASVRNVSSPNVPLESVPPWSLSLRSCSFCEGFTRDSTQRSSIGIYAASSHSLRLSLRSLFCRSVPLRVIPSAASPSVRHFDESASIERYSFEPSPIETPTAEPVPPKRLP